MATSMRLMKAFIAEAVGHGAPDDPDGVVRFVVLLTTSFAERTTGEGTSGAELVRQADRFTDMLVARFGIR
ncbi:hypothetical protein [Burkholderia perseverans]|uniref:hypothetical protein n=1 Tax=Burkholderia perseverans TaxID=2615214 RepID=UPI001FEF6792|nr:hypothetical protein [Burkholderia perseverans]